MQSEKREKELRLFSNFLLPSLPLIHLPAHAVFGRYIRKLNIRPTERRRFTVDVSQDTEAYKLIDWTYVLIILWLDSHNL